MDRARFPYLLALAVALVPAGPLSPGAAPAQEAGNPHNVRLCLVCHKETPRFGVDTRATASFRIGGWDDPKLCAICHHPGENLHPVLVAPGAGELGTRAPSGLPLGESPGLEGQVVCTTCHFLHAADTKHSLLRGFPGSQQPGRFAAWQDLCRECHGEGLARRTPHAGDERACAFCHGAQPKPGERPPVAPRGRSLCNFCHGGLQDRHAAKADPFDRPPEGCAGCHDPHLGPDHPARLREEYRAAARDAVRVSPHYRRSALCEACHLPAGTPALRSPDPVVLCNRCHGTGEIVGDIHPIRKVPEAIRPPADWPLAKGFLTCLTCHSAGHEEDAGSWKFLRGGPYPDRNDFCGNCHAPEASRGRNPHLDINRGEGCEFCHAVRPVPGRDTIETVRFIADPNILCLRCHAELPHPAGVEHTMTVSPERAATIPRELPVWKGGKVVCATCHNPHVAEVEGHKLRQAGGSFTICVACHDY